MFDSVTLWTVPARLLCPCNSPGQNTGVGSCSLLQGIFPTQGLNLGFPLCRWVLYQLSPQGSPERECNLLLCSFLPGKSHGQRSLGGCSPWTHKEPDMTERLTLSLSYKYIFLFIFFSIIVYHKILNTVTHAE